MRKIAGNMADGSALALHIEQGDISFGGGIKFEDLRNAEAILECVPNLQRHAIAARETNPMRGLKFRRRGVKEIPAKLPYVLKQCAVPAHKVIPEFAR